MISTASRRLLALAAALGSALVAAVVVGAAPAAAQESPGVGTRTGSGMSTAEILLVFVGIPALIFAVCAVLVYATAGRGDARLREGRSWWAEADYYSATEKPGAGAPAGATGEATADDAAGGSSARW